MRMGIIFWVALVPLFAHGCHGDDVDHEPMITLPDEGRGASRPPER